MGVLDAPEFYKNTWTGKTFWSMCLYVFAKPTRPGMRIPGLASMVMPPLPTALKGYFAHADSIAPKQEKLKHFV